MMRRPMISDAEKIKIKNRYEIWKQSNRGETLRSNKMIRRSSDDFSARWWPFLGAGPVLSTARGPNREEGGTKKNAFLFHFLSVPLQPEEEPGPRAKNVSIYIYIYIKKVVTQVVPVEISRGHLHGPFLGVSNGARGAAFLFFFFTDFTERME